MAATATPKCKHVGKTFGRLKVLKAIARVGKQWRLQVECLNCGHVYERMSDSMRKNCGGCQRCRKAQQKRINEWLFQWPNSREGDSADSVAQGR